MPLNGSGAAFVKQIDLGQAFLAIVKGVPTGSFPAGGEPLNDLLVDAVMGGQVKIHDGVKCLWAIAQSDHGHVWDYDPVADTLIAYTAIGSDGAAGTPEASGAYGSGFTGSVVTICCIFAKYSSS